MHCIVYIIILHCGPLFITRSSGSQSITNMSASQHNSSIERQRHALVVVVLASVLINVAMNTIKRRTTNKLQQSVQ